MSSGKMGQGGYKSEANLYNIAKPCLCPETYRCVLHIIVIFVLRGQRQEDNQSKL